MKLSERCVRFKHFYSKSIGFVLFIEDMNQIIDEVKQLEQQIEKLKAENDILDINNQQFAEMIEKLKCCGNCNHDIYDRSIIKWICRFDEEEIQPDYFCDKWELAE